MDRSIWTDEISKHHCPAWQCPRCKIGTVFLTKDSLTYLETIDSLRSHSHEDFDFEWIEYIFTAWAQCSNKLCNQAFAISGTGGVAPQYVSESEWEYKPYFSPKACHPMPDIIMFPNKCPNEIKDELRAAFESFWSNPAACASRMRIALEYLMNYLSVPKQKQDSNGKLIDLNLHARIDAYAKNDLNIGAQIMALKWLGNAGSHEGSLNTTELLDAFEIMEHVLREVISGHSKRVDELAKILTDKHGKKPIL